MQQFIPVLIFCIIAIIINLKYLNKYFGKNYKTEFKLLLFELTKSCNYKIIEDKKIFNSKIIDQQIILGKDIDYQLYISKLAELYLEVVFRNMNSSSSIFKFQKKIIGITFKLCFLLSIIFYVGINLSLFLNNDLSRELDLMDSSFSIIVILMLISLLILFFSYASFKKNIKLSEKSFSAEQIKLIPILYWYIPISILNYLLSPIEYTRWLFSKN